VTDVCERDSGDQAELPGPDDADPHRQGLYVVDVPIPDMPERTSR
jgi:hypothetical protein